VPALLLPLLFSLSLSLSLSLYIYAAAPPPLTLHPPCYVICPSRNKHLAEQRKIKTFACTETQNPYVTSAYVSIAEKKKSKLLPAQRHKEPLAI